MKVSVIKVILTNDDIMGIIKEFVNVEGLNFDSIEIKEIITIKGSYKKGVKIPFKARIGIGNIHDNAVRIKVFDINIAKLGIISSIRNFALKKALDKFGQYGIAADKDGVILDLNLISKFIPYAYFKLKSIDILENSIQAEVEDIIYAQDKQTNTFDKDDKYENIKKIEDDYSKLRKNIEEKIPNKYEKIVEYALIIPDILALLWRIFKDKRVNIKTKVLVAGIITYLALPIDIIPDFIPFIGKIDDVAVAFFGLDKIMNEVPENVIIENWQGSKDIIFLVKEAVSYISKMVGSKNVAKLVNFINDLKEKNRTKEWENEGSSDIH